MPKFNHTKFVFLEPIPNRHDAVVVVARMRNSDQSVGTDVTRKFRRLLKQFVPALKSAAKNFVSDFHFSISKNPKSYRLFRSSNLRDNRN